MTQIDCGLILQGGGALGAYEWGAVLCLVDKGYNPKVVGGVSIGAINAAAIAGAPDGDVKASLNALWNAITIPSLPFIPPSNQAWTSMFGNPAFWASRTDFLNMATWTSLSTVDPMRKTLAKLLDFKRLNDTGNVRIGVNATKIRTGTIQRFLSTEQPLTAEHILASGALPTGFPAVEIEGDWYWDGGLLNNTPILSVLDMMTDEEYTTMPLFSLDLFPSTSDIPQNLLAVTGRMTEMSYMNKTTGYKDEFEHLLEFIRTAKGLLPADSKILQLTSLKRADAFDQIHIVTAPHPSLTGGTDFSDYGIKNRRDQGYRAMERYINDLNSARRPAARDIRHAVPRAVSPPRPAAARAVAAA